MLGNFVAAVIVGFYLYLTVNGKKIQRPIVYWIGLGAVVLAFMVEFFTLGEGKALRIVYRIFTILSWTSAFLLAVVAAFSGELPVNLAGQAQPPVAQQVDAP